MGDHRAHDPAAASGWPASRDRHAGRHERGALRVAYGMPMAAVAERFSTALHRLHLFLGMDALRRARPHPPRAACEGARDGGPRGKPDRRHHRYTGCESDRKRGPQKDPVGYDAAKKTKGIKRNVIVDTIGLLLGIAVIPANIQDRDCAANLIRKTRCLFPWIAKLFADGGYAGAKLKAALAGQPVELEIVKRTDNEGVQGRTPAMGDRTDVVLAPTQSTFDGPLRSLRPHRRRLRQARNDMCHAQAARRAKA